MFEKEAIKYYVDNLEGKLEVNNESRLEEQFEDTFVRGAICGYNKANEWHKDLPTEDVELAIIEVEDCGYLLCEYRKGVWYDKGSSAICKDWITQNIKRWKEIVLPKESK